jgi:hypothetical protein
MESPIMKLSASRDSLERELEGLIEKEKIAKEEAKNISEEMDKLKMEADGTLFLSLLLHVNTVKHIFSRASVFAVLVKNAGNY